MHGLLEISLRGLWRLNRTPGLPFFLLSVSEKLRSLRKRVIYGMFGINVVSCLLLLPLLERSTICPFWGIFKME